jgi:hypothetical protein
MAGRKLLKNFLILHPHFPLQRPQSVSLERVKCFVKENLTLFFDLLRPEMEKVKFDLSKVFIFDETAQYKPNNVVSMKGKMQVPRHQQKEFHCNSERFNK